MRKKQTCGVFLMVVGVGLAGCSTTPAAPEDPDPEPVVGQPAPDPVDIAFTAIPHGAFLMGSENGQPDERPVHEVTISSFEIGTYEVTQELFQEVMGFNPSGIVGPSLPVEQVTWAEASQFCGKLAVRNGGNYRLPTEAEWEYAARGGMDGREYVWGDTLPPMVEGVLHANLPDVSFASVYPTQANAGGYLSGYDDGYPLTAPVGSFAPNGFGLYDMAGNVAEWVADYYVLGTQYYAVSPQQNPKGPSSGADRGIRGASWWAAPNRYFRVAARFRDTPSIRTPTLGFRCVKVVPEG